MAAKTTKTIELREYNGWTNYPTWNAFLWLSNDQDTWNAFLAFGQKGPTVEQVRAYVRAYVYTSDYISGCRADIEGFSKHYDRSLHWALEQIDYESIRAHLADAVGDAI